MVLSRGKTDKVFRSQIRNCHRSCMHPKPFLGLEEKLKLNARIRGEYFKGATQIKVDDIQKAFRSLCDKEEGGKKKKAEKEKDLATNRVKIALFYFLEGVLLGADPKRNVSTFHMSVVDDLDMFNSYPWGTMVYDTTINSLGGRIWRRSTASV